MAYQDEYFTDFGEEWDILRKYKKKMLTFIFLTRNMHEFSSNFIPNNPVEDYMLKNARKIQDNFITNGLILKNSSPKNRVKMVFVDENYCDFNYALKTILKEIDKVY